MVFFKQEKGDEYRVSLRSKGNIDIGSIAKEYGGGGHKNAAGLTVSGPIEELQRTLVEKIEAAIDTEHRHAEHASGRTRVTRADGLLIVDKPAGPTSHDVVARLRRALREKQIGHTGTLDPMATGVLVLVIGKATRLAKFLSASDKSYEAVVRFGFATDTADAQGQPIGERQRAPSRRAKRSTPRSTSFAARSCNSRRRSRRRKSTDSAATSSRAPLAQRADTQPSRYKSPAHLPARTCHLPAHLPYPPR